MTSVDFGVPTVRNAERYLNKGNSTAGVVRVEANLMETCAACSFFVCYKCTRKCLTLTMKSAPRSTTFAMAPVGDN